MIGRPFTEIKPNDEYKVGQINIKVVYAYNTPIGNSTRKVHHKGGCVGYLLTIDGKTIYHAGDTDIIPEMKAFGKVDIAFLPIGGTFTMDLQEAVQATSIINPNIVVPIHFLKANPDIFKREVEQKLKTKTVILKTGQSYEL